MPIQALLRSLRGCCALLLFVIIYCVFSLLLIISFSLCLLIPINTLKRHAQYQSMKLFSCAWISFYGVIRLLRICQWKTHSGPTLNHDDWYLMISNHVSWLDILAVGVAFSFTIPPLKFFLKKELRWSLPLAGFAAHLAGFPFLERSSKSKGRHNKNKRQRQRAVPKDIETAQDTCKKLLLNPSTLILFPEGTRFSPEKSQRQHAPYQHLLKPKSAGVATVINEMQEKLSGIIDVTLHYRPQKISLWGFLCGKLDTIEISYQVLPISPELIGDYKHDRNYRKQVQTWLNGVWARKDSALAEMHHE